MFLKFIEIGSDNAFKIGFPVQEGITLSVTSRVLQLNKFGCESTNTTLNLMSESLCSGHGTAVSFL